MHRSCRDGGSLAEHDDTDPVREHVNQNISLVSLLLRTLKVAPFPEVLLLTVRLPPSGVTETCPASWVTKELTRMHSVVPQTR